MKSTLTESADGRNKLKIKKIEKKEEKNYKQ